MNRRIVYLLLGVVVLPTLLFFTSYLLSLRSLTVSYENVQKVKIYKTIALDSGNAPTPKVVITKSGKSVKLPKGQYTAYYEGKAGYESRFMVFDLRHSRSLTIRPSYSEARLDSILNSEQVEIDSVLYANYPKANLYKMNKGKLYRNGTWYGTTLTYIGSDQYNSDTLRVIFHKESGNWVIKTNPPDIVFNAFDYPDIPKDILTDVNNS